ncbi:hypothetical protein JQ625_22325 [Bradyrhizobium diazoefficiens]|nr:T6SS amidase immunity protein Tai4 family protein [Bradyrhizobium diazoefficiens]MBR0777578.1 hypothetical protein [Bradyrhizobium diazoefficiens]
MFRSPSVQVARGLRATSGALAAIAVLAASPVAAADRVEYSAVQSLKNFALSACIADGYRSDEVVNDSKAAAGGYLELGRLPYQAYEEAAQLGRAFLAKDYQGKSGERLTLMKCIDLFHSKELDQLARKYRK